MKRQVTLQLECECTDELIFSDAIAKALRKHADFLDQSREWGYELNATGEQLLPVVADMANNMKGNYNVTLSWEAQGDDTAGHQLRA